MTSTGLGLAQETVMRRMPYPVSSDIDPRRKTLCVNCHNALNIGNDLFLTATYMSITDDVLCDRLSLDAIHRKAPIEDVGQDKAGWQHILRFYSHDRRTYIQNMGITVFYREDEHTELCEQSHITVEMNRQKTTSGIIYNTFHSVKDMLIKQCRYIVSPGTTLVEVRRSPILTTYNIQINIGQDLRNWRLTSGFSYMYGWVHRIPPAPVAENQQEVQEEKEEEHIVYPVTEVRQRNLVDDLRTDTLEALKQRLNKPRRRGTN